ncbi:LacI family DNA-binding transcriptional regulator [Ruficoccus sp. ZRK36]|uniref:LacI family DNA-binding transcriptional regulator n=1 Tax=Ruficoccus sp. ZRK36 TaxID=2866311 RepID=UPI001C72E86F|nr:LacI family DNA-binding transcriptional regulator [Ruficoccus sp. ZRK36]QYY37269.1 LacI family transcriptional regulator [Ruficoccus sp. ZRK36]
MAGVHRSTVSLVFRNHPSIPDGTRERILAIANKLGYTPDPMLAALAAYRKRQHPSDYKATVVWLVKDQKIYDWRDTPMFVEYYEGAYARLAQYGYKLEIFELNTKEISPRRVASIFRSRNIPGILLCPQPTPNVHLDFPWEHFSSVTFGYTLVEPQLHVVAASQYRANRVTMMELKKRGYKRIGFTYNGEFNRRTDHNYMAGYLVETIEEDYKRLVVPPLVSPIRERPEELLKWCRRYKVDAIVTPDSQILEVAERCGLSCPEDIGIACTPLYKPDGKLSGYYEHSIHTGEAAADFLIAMIQRGERGIPKIPHRLHIDGIWCPGSTLRPLTRQKSQKAGSAA